jgi:hypothetical protein
VYASIYGVWARRECWARDSYEQTESILGLEREREIDPIIIDFTINAIRKNSFFCLFYTIVSFEGGECAETMMRNNNKMSYSV